MDELAVAPSASTSFPAAQCGLPRTSPLELSVSEMREAEQQAPPLPAPAPAQPNSRSFRAQKLNAALTLQSWIKELPHLHAVPLGQGEPSVAVLLLWEADHKQSYPCGKTELAARLNYFSKRLVDAVAADSELSSWLQRAKTRMVLSSGLRPTSSTRWAVRIRP